MRTRTGQFYPGLGNYILSGRQIFLDNANLWFLKASSFVAITRYNVHHFQSVE